MVPRSRLYAAQLPFRSLPQPVIRSHLLTRKPRSSSAGAVLVSSPGAYHRFQADVCFVPPSPFDRPPSPRIVVEQLTSSVGASRSPGRDCARCALCGTALVPYCASPKEVGNALKGVTRSLSWGHTTPASASNGMGYAVSSSLIGSDQAVSASVYGGEIPEPFEDDEAVLRKMIRAAQKQVEDAVAKWQALQSEVSDTVRGGLHDLGVLKACVASDRSATTVTSDINRQLHRVDAAVQQVEAALRSLVLGQTSSLNAMECVVSSLGCEDREKGSDPAGPVTRHAVGELGDTSGTGTHLRETEIEVLCDELREAQKAVVECISGPDWETAKNDSELVIRAERDKEIEVCFRELEAACNGIDVARRAGQKVSEEWAAQSEVASQHFRALEAAEAQAAEETSNAMAATVEAVAAAAGHTAGVHDAAEVARHVRRQSLECEAARELAAAAARQLRLEQEEKLSALESCGSLGEESFVEEALLLATEACVRIQAILPPASDEHEHDIDADELVGVWPSPEAGRLSELIKEGREAVLNLARQAILSRQLFLSEQQGKMQRELLAKSMLQKLADAQRQLKENASVLSRTTSRRGAVTSPRTGMEE